MGRKILIGVVVLVGAFVAVVASRPAEFRIERSTLIAAEPGLIFEHLEDFHSFEQWSPWDKLDPDMSRSFEGAESGVGAIYSWKGNDKVGEGRMTILETRPAELVRVRLEFFKPWEAINTTSYILEPADGRTRVSWRMEGENDFMGKAITMFMDMDSMIGADFENGLSDLKRFIEAVAKQRAEEEAAAVEAARAAAEAAQLAASDEERAADATE